MILKTLAQAKKYAASLAALHNKTICVFPVSKEAQAYEYGYRFGTCPAEERAEYEAGGAKIVVEVSP